MIGRREWIEDRWRIDGREESMARDLVVLVGVGVWPLLLHHPLILVIPLTESENGKWLVSRLHFPLWYRYAARALGLEENERLKFGAGSRLLVRLWIKHDNIRIRNKQWSGNMPLSNGFSPPRMVPLRSLGLKRLTFGDSNCPRADEQHSSGRALDRSES